MDPYFSMTRELPPGVYRYSQKRNGRTVQVRKVYLGSRSAAAGATRTERQWPKHISVWRGKYRVRWKEHNLGSFHFLESAIHHLNQLLGFNDERLDWLVKHYRDEYGGPGSSRAGNESSSSSSTSMGAGS